MLGRIHHGFTCGPNESLDSVGGLAVTDHDDLDWNASLILHLGRFRGQRRFQGCLRQFLAVERAPVLLADVALRAADGRARPAGSMRKLRS